LSPALLLLLAAILAARNGCLSGKMGKMLFNAMRDREERVRFSGYDVSMFKVFRMFCLAAILSGIGGALFVLQVGFIAPSLVGIVPSIEMVIFAAVGGRASLFGAVYGTLLVNAGKSLFSEQFPAGLAVLHGRPCSSAWWCLFPNGLVGMAGIGGAKSVAGSQFWPSSRPAAANRMPAEVANVVARKEKTHEQQYSFLLSIEDLTVSFDGFKAVDALNLYVEKDELRVIIGPNGAGKTTCWT
jgi:ABC-type multidrug transport system fused ATPase/permease subunit